MVAGWDRAEGERGWRQNHALMESKAKRTLVKSAPELWELADDPARMQSWMSDLVGGGPVLVEVTDRDPERVLAWRSAQPGADGRSRSSLPRAASAPRSGSPPSTRSPIRARRSPHSRGCSMSSDPPGDARSAPPERPARARPELDLAASCACAAGRCRRARRSPPGRAGPRRGDRLLRLRRCRGARLRPRAVRGGPRGRGPARGRARLRRRRARREARRRPRAPRSRTPGTSTTRPATGSRAAPGSPSTSAAGCCARASATTAAAPSR